SSPLALSPSPSQTISLTRSLSQIHSSLDSSPASLLMNALLPQKNYPLLPPSLPSAPRSRSPQLSPLSHSSALHILLASLPPLSPASQASAGPPYRSLSPASLSPSLSVPAPCTPATTLLPSSLSHFLLPPLLPSSPHIPPVLLLLLSPLPLPSPP